MIQIELLEKIFLDYLKEQPCEDHSCNECKEIEQLFDSDLIYKFIDNTVKQMKPASYHEDILQTFYLGFKMGRELEKLNYT